MEDGLLTAGLPCSSFVWINAATSQRSSSNPLGNSDLSYVKEANMTLECYGMLLTLLFGLCRIRVSLMWGACCFLNARLSGWQHDWSC